MLRYIQEWEQGKTPSASMESQGCEPDMSEEEYNINKNRLLNELHNQAKTRQDIERQTIQQAQDPRWHQLRRPRLTSSKFADVCKKCVNSNSARLVDRLLFTTSYVQHWNYESLATSQLEKQENIIIRKCGLFIDEKLPFLGASPNGLYDNGIVKIFCPTSAFGIPPEEAINMGKVKFWNANGTVSIKDRHFYQIQGQLHITKKSKCIYAVWTGTEFPLKIQEIERDDSFWYRVMERKLTDFYEKCYLPELVDSRKNRSMPIRDICNWHW